MLRNTIGAVLACVYVALSVWLVRYEGQSYRDGRKQAKSARSVTESPVRGRTGELEEPPKVVAASAVAPEPRLAERRDNVAAGPAPAPIPAPPAEPAGPKPNVRPEAEPKQVAPQPAQVAMHKPASTKAADARLATLDPFWNEPEVKKNWNLEKLSDQEEMRLGEALNDMIMRFNPPTPGGPWQERVYTAAKPLLSRVTRKDIKYTFTILESEEVNAFSHSGGYVYISRGLFPFMGEDEDAVLQFILAHEIAHVDLRHMIRCLQDPGVQKIQMGTLEKGSPFYPSPGVSGQAGVRGRSVGVWPTHTDSTTRGTKRSSSSASSKAMPRRTNSTMVESSTSRVPALRRSKITCGRIRPRGDV